MTILAGLTGYLSTLTTNRKQMIAFIKKTKQQLFSLLP
jgi:hypothetical protein